MKVAFATYDSARDIGGASIWLHRLLPFLQSSGIQVEVYVMAFEGRPGANCNFFEKNGIPFRWTPWQRHTPHAVQSFLQFLEQGQPDIFVPNCILPAYFAAGYARRSGIPTVGVFHSDDPFYWGLLDEVINGDPLFRLSAVVPVSKFLESALIPAASAAGVSVFRIGCGVPIPRKSARPAKSSFRVIYTGRLVEEQKRISEVTIALCKAAQKISNLDAWIVGEGEAHETVKRIIHENGMGSQVHLLGRVDNTKIYDLLAECHALVLLSDYEGLPVSMLEAMATGVVPICLDMRSGIRDAVQDGVNGLIVKDRSEDFIAAISELETDSGKWQRLSSAARSTVVEEYSIEQCARQWASLLHSLDTRRPSSAPFKAPFVLRLPPPNPSFGRYDVRLSRSMRFKDYIRSMPAVYQPAKALLSRRRKHRSSK